MLKNLIGAQVVNVADDYIVVRKGDEQFTLEIYAHEGDCCSYADFTTTLLYSPNDIRNPVITHIEEQIGDTGYDSLIITFFGEAKPLVMIESVCGSESGYDYGAYVKLHCKALGIDETLVAW